MKKNIGKTDKMIRLIIAMFLFMLYVSHAFKGTAGDIVLTISLALFTTGLMNFCPLYLPFGFNTRSDEDNTGDKKPQ